MTIYFASISAINTCLVAHAFVHVTLRRYNNLISLRCQTNTTCSYIYRLLQCIALKLRGLRFGFSEDALLPLNACLTWYILIELNFCKTSLNWEFRSLPNERVNGDARSAKSWIQSAGVLHSWPPTKRHGRVLVVSVCLSDDNCRKLWRKFIFAHPLYLMGQFKFVYEFHWVKP